MRGGQGRDHGVRVILTLMTERGHDANKLIKQ